MPAPYAVVIRQPQSTNGNGHWTPTRSRRSEPATALRGETPGRRTRNPTDSQRWSASLPSCDRSESLWCPRPLQGQVQPEQYFRDGKQRFGLNRSTVTTTDRLQRLLVALLLACCLLILAGLQVSPAFRRRVCSRGKLGILHLGYEYFLATPDPPPHIFTPSHHQTGYA